MGLKQQENGGHRNWPAAPLIVFGILILLRLVLSSRLPSYIIGESPHDDGWVVSRTLYILKGEWLGPYDQMTLIKGPFSPLLMAFSAYVGVSFGALNTALYCLACAVFVISVRSIIKTHWLQLLLFAVLLFNPLSYALDTGQRVYRNGIGQWQILLIFGCLIAVFLRRNENWKGLLGWALGGGLVLGAFFQTREDGTWIYPFVLGSIFYTAIVFWLEKQRPRIKVAIFLLPMAIAWSFSGAVALQNYSQYGDFITNDRGGGNFAKVAGDLYAIAPNADDEKLYESDAYKDKYYNIYVSTMEQAFSVSPTLNSVSPKIRDAIRAWGRWEDIKTGELSTDHMLFALRDGVRGAGYYRSLPQTEAFYGKVHEELRTAFKNGTLLKQGFAISPLIKRLQMHDLVIALSLVPEAIRNIAGFKDVSSKSLPATGSVKHINEFGLVAGGEYYTSKENVLSGAGWAFAEDDKTRLNAGLYDKQGASIVVVPFQPGEDVFAAFKSKYQNAKLSRFSFTIDGYNLQSGLTLRFFDETGSPAWKIPVDGSATCGGTDGLFHYCIDSLKSESTLGDLYNRLAERANQVIGVYQKIMPFVAILACLVYFAATRQLILEFNRRDVLNTLPVWLILSGLASTFLLFVFAMSIITATSFPAVAYLYTGAAHLLLLMFCGVSVLWAGEVFIEQKTRGRP